MIRRNVQFATTLATRLLVLGVALVFTGSTAKAGQFEGIWTGTYDCQQGKTGLMLTVTADTNGLNAIFAFMPHPSNPTVPMGSFMMHGGMKPGSNTIEFKPMKWIQQPPGFVSVGLVGKLKNNKFTGKITGAPGCKGFSLVRAAAPGMGMMGGFQMPTLPAESAPAPVAAPAPKPAPKPVKRQSCKSALLKAGHAAVHMIHCDDDVNRACAVALLEAGHSPAHLVHCQDISDVDCAVALLESGKSPAQIVHCD
jgi:hypothetical protein